MAATPSSMVPLGTPIPDFALPDADGTVHLAHDLVGEHGTLVAFICNHCPFVKHVAAELAALGRELPERGVGMVAINSNDATAYPDDAPDKMIEESAEWGWTFPYLVDEAQQLAREFEATCTPDFFLYDGEGCLAYRGQLDPSRPGNDVPVTGSDLRSAVDALVAGTPVPAEQVPSIGCNIKWRPAAE